MNRHKKSMRSRLCAVVILALLVGLGSAATAQSAPIAASPPMGWNSWNHFATRVTDTDIRRAADAMVSSGMRDAGYLYVNIDDSWEGKRDAKGVIHSNEKFPDMKALADYVHSQGLRLGIYSSPGPTTCAGFEGSYGHEEQDAQTYADWGVDYLKYDLCSYRSIMEKQVGHDVIKLIEMEKAAYLKMHRALLKTGRPIVFSMCQYGRFDTWMWGADVGGNLWRTTSDIKDNYASMSNIGFHQDGLAPFAGIGHWNDPDMLEIGNGGMSDDEYRTHMNLWVILAAPLLAGNDLSAMSPQTQLILTNAAVIAVDQDALGKQGDRVLRDGYTEVWAKPLIHNAQAIAIFNRADEARTVIVDLARVGVSRHATVRDLWLHKNVATLHGVFTQVIPKHGSVLLKVIQ